MTREEIIKEAMGYAQIGRFGYYKGTYDEMNGRLYYERLFDQWEPKPTPWYQKSFICRSLL